MELRNLESFVAVAEQLSFVRAAERLHLSQPALSAQIQKLEDEIGVKLLFRNKRTVRLTDAGRVFLAEAHATLARAQQAVERAQKADRGEIGRLRIGFVSSAALAIVPAIAGAFRKQFPGVTLDLMNLRTSSQIKSLVNKTIDVGFVRLPVAHDQLDTKVIHREGFAVVLPADHALAKKKQIRLSDLRAERFVAYGRRWAPGFYDAVVQMCTSQGFSPNITQETGEMYTAIALVAAGTGVAILPKTVVLAQSQGVVMKPLPLAAGVSEIAIAVRKRDRSTLVESFVQLTTELGKTISSNQ